MYHVGAGVVHSITQGARELEHKYLPTQVHVVCVCVWGGWGGGGGVAVPIIKTIVYWCPYWGSYVLGSYHLSF